MCDKYLRKKEITMINRSCSSWRYYEFYRKLSINSPDCVLSKETHNTKTKTAGAVEDSGPDAERDQGYEKIGSALFKEELESAARALPPPSKAPPRYADRYRKAIGACLAGDYDTFTSCLLQDDQVPTEDTWYTLVIIRCMAICAAFGHRDILCYIFAKYPNVATLCSDKGDYPMHWAQDPATADFLVSHGAALNPPNRVDGNTPLHTLISYGNTETALHIIEIAPQGSLKTIINARNRDGNTPLGVACLFGRFDVVGKLLTKGADFRDTNNLKLTPMHMAAIGNHQNIVQYLGGLNDVKYQITSRDMHGNSPMEVCIAFNGSHHELAWTCIGIEGKIVDFSFINKMLGGDFARTKIGAGTFGSVYRPTSPEYRKYAIKEVVLNSTSKQRYEKHKKRFITEIGLMNSFDESQRKYFPSLIWVSKKDDTHFYFVTQFFGKGTLSDLIQRKTTIPGITVNYITSEIAKGMK